MSLQPLSAQPCEAKDTQRALEAIAEGPGGVWGPICPPAPKDTIPQHPLPRLLGQREHRCFTPPLPGISLMWPESISAPGRIPQYSATFLSRLPQPPSHHGSNGFVPMLSALRTGKPRSGFNGRTTRAGTQLENGSPLKKTTKTQENRKKPQPTNYKKTKNQKQVKKKEYHRYCNPFFYFLDHL